MTNEEKHKIIMNEVAKVDSMDDMNLMVNFAKLKAMNLHSTNQDDKDITFEILKHMEVAMKDRKIMIEGETHTDNGIGMVVKVPKPKPAVKFNPKNVVKKDAKVPKELMYKGKLTFHSLMNANEARLLKEGEPA